MMTETLTVEKVREEVASTISEMLDDLDADTDRNTLIERMDEECDGLWGNLVKHGRIDQYDVDDLIETAAPCALVLKVASEDAWVENDHGLWEGLTYGVLASIAYFSLRNLLYEACKAEGVDSNEELPLEGYKSEAKDED
jgi:hypothetical protein